MSRTSLQNIIVFINHLEEVLNDSYIKYNSLHPRIIAYANKSIKIIHKKEKA